MKESLTQTIIRRSFLTLFAVFCFIPILWLFMNSFKGAQEFFASNFFPKVWHFDNYFIALVQRGIWKYYGISIILVAVCVGISTILSLLCAYSLTRMSFRYEKAILAMFLVIMMLPPQLGIIPLFLMFSKLKLLGNPLSLLFPYVLSGIPISLLLIYTQFKVLPRDLDEAAKIDGAGHITILFKILVPIAKPIIATTIIISSMGVWNEYLLASTFMSGKWTTLPVAIVQSTQANIIDNQPLNIATIILGFLPLLILFLFLQRQFISGLAGGAVK